VFHFLQMPVHIPNLQNAVDFDFSRASWVRLFYSDEICTVVQITHLDNVHS
jgi:hypothetical protein